MSDSYGFVRLANRYEKRFQMDFQKVLKEREFHIQQLRLIIEQANKAQNLISGDIANWGECIQVVYDVDDANTLWQKFDLSIMKWYVNKMYAKALEESRMVGLGKEKLEKLLNRLLVMGAF